MKRQVRWVYKAALKKRKMLDIESLISYYDEYNQLRNKILNDESAPSKLKVAMPSINLPKYMEWIRLYLNEKENEEE